MLFLPLGNKSRLMCYYCRCIFYFSYMSSCEIVNFVFFYVNHLKMICTEQVRASHCAILPNYAVIDWHFDFQHAVGSELWLLGCLLFLTMTWSDLVVNVLLGVGTSGKIGNCLESFWRCFYNPFQMDVQHLNIPDQKTAKTSALIQLCR